MNKKKIIPSDDKDLDLYEFRDDKEIIVGGKGLRFERKPNLERRRVLQLEEQTK